MHLHFISNSTKQQGEKAGSKALHINGELKHC